MTRGRVISRGNVWKCNSHCLRVHYGWHCEPFSGQSALNFRILHIQSKIFSGGDTPETPKSAPQCLDPEPISAWLVSVPTVPVL